MKMLILTLISLTASLLTADAENPTTENKDWEEACGGSNIAVTSIAGNLVSIDAFVEHFAEGRQWQCHFKDGKIVSALYRHFTVTRKATGDGGEFTTVQVGDGVEVFHFPDHQISEMDPALMNDLLKVIAIATNKSQASVALLAEEAKQALIVEVPETWEVEFKGDKGMQFYSVTRKEGDVALLMFSRSPVAGNVKQIPEQVEALAKSFADLAKDGKAFKLKSDKYKIEEIVGDTFSGRFVQFEIEGGFTQTMFMIGDTEGIWNGQFTGTKERWAEALLILKKLKKDG